MNLQIARAETTIVVFFTPAGDCIAKRRCLHGPGPGPGPEGATIPQTTRRDTGTPRALYPVKIGYSIGPAVQYTRYQIPDTRYELVPVTRDKGHRASRSRLPSRAPKRDARGRRQGGGGGGGGAKVPSSTLRSSASPPGGAHPPEEEEANGGGSVLQIQGGSQHSLRRSNVRRPEGSRQQERRDAIVSAHEDKKGCQEPIRKNAAANSYLRRSSLATSK